MEETYANVEYYKSGDSVVSLNQTGKNVQSDRLRVTDWAANKSVIIYFHCCIVVLTGFVSIQVWGVQRGGFMEPLFSVWGYWV